MMTENTELVSAERERTLRSLDTSLGRLPGRLITNIYQWSGGDRSVGEAALHPAADQALVLGILCHVEKGGWNVVGRTVTLPKLSTT